MKIRTLIFVSALTLTPILSANTFLCTLAVGNNSPVAYSTGCGSSFAYTNTFDWASLNPSPLGVTSGPTYQSSTNPHLSTNPWTGTDGNETVSAALSNHGSDFMQLDGNTAFVYAGVTAFTPTGYMSASGSDTAVQLGFPTINAADPVLWSYGETLLTEQNGDSPLTISFSHPVSGVEFQISTLSSPNFIATLVAYGANGTVLGTYVLNTNGTNVGGTCASLKSAPGAPCTNPAPYIGITDDELHLGSGMIAKVAVYTNVPGFAIGTMDIIATPEPAAFLLAAVGLGLVMWRKRRPSLASRR